MHYSGEIRNTLPVLIDFFSRKKQSIVEHVGEANLASLSELRARTFLKLMSSPSPDLNDENLNLAVREALNDSSKKIDYLKITNQLPKLTQSVFKSFLEDLDLFGITKEVGKSLDEVFKLMRLIERKIQKRPQAAPVQQLRRKGWSRLSPRQREAAELSLMGFNKNQIPEIMGGNPETRVNQKAEALRRMGLNAMQFRQLEHGLAQTNIENIDSVYKHRLFDFVFNTNEQRQGLNSQQTRERAIRILELFINEKLNDAERILIKTFLNTQEYKAAANAASFSEDHAPNKIKTIREDLANFYTSFLEDKFARPPSPLIDTKKWSLLNTLEKQTILLYLNGLSLKNILKRLQNDQTLAKIIDSSFNKPLTKTPQIQNFICGVKTKLGITDQSSVSAIKASISLSKNPQDKEVKIALIKRIFNNKIPQGKGLLGKDRNKHIDNVFDLIYQHASEFLNGERLEEFKLYAKGLTATQISRQLKDGRSPQKIKDQLSALKKYIQRELEKYQA